MSKGTEKVEKCNDQIDLEERRNKAKKAAKEAGTFMRCEGDSVLLKNGDKITFVIDDEHLPPEAFDEKYQRMARDAAISMLE
jgi:hypothetical protein